MNSQYWVTRMSVWGPNISPGWFTLNGSSGVGGAGSRSWWWARGTGDE